MYLTTSQQLKSLGSYGIEDRGNFRSFDANVFNVLFYVNINVSIILLLIHIIVML